MENLFLDKTFISGTIPAQLSSLTNVAYLALDEHCVISCLADHI